MRADRVQILNDAFSMYNALMGKIKDLYTKSEEYIITTRPELKDVLADAEAYMHEVFNCIANASGGVSEEEQAFINKLTIYNKEIVEAEGDSIIKSTFNDVPKYIELANIVDKLADTTYAKELINDTLTICKELMDIDGNTYADESSFTYSFIGMLEKYVKEK